MSLSLRRLARARLRGDQRHAPPAYYYYYYHYYYYYYYYYINSIIIIIIIIIIKCYYCTLLSLLRASGGRPPGALRSVSIMVGYSMTTMFMSTHSIGIHNASFHYNTHT